MFNREEENDGLITHHYVTNTLTDLVVASLLLRNTIQHLNNTAQDVPKTHIMWVFQNLPKNEWSETFTIINNNTSWLK